MVNSKPYNLLDYDIDSLADLFEANGFQRFRSQQLIKWIHQKLIDDFDQMSNIGKALISWLKINTTILPPPIKHQQISQDGTIKWLLSSAEGHYEMVYIPEKNRGTLCVSSQVGCALACKFCATGKQGFTRNLSCHEIIGQLWLANRVVQSIHGKDRAITNVVFMGMGEPLMNVGPVFKAVGLMLNDLAYGLSKYRVTISTVGVVPVMKKMLHKNGPALAVSLHAPNEQLRSSIIPLNNKFSLKLLLDTCRDYTRTTNREITFEYTMMHDQNDRLEHAEELSNILKQIDCKINLIPCNPIEDGIFLPSNKKRLIQFQSRLQKNGYHVTIRKTRGDDINAACGQLAETFLKTKKSLVRIET